jgi:hypothetical protein
MAAHTSDQSHAQVWRIKNNTEIPTSNVIPRAKPITIDFGLGAACLFPFRRGIHIGTIRAGRIPIERSYVIQRIARIAVPATPNAIRRRIEDRPLLIDGLLLLQTKSNAANVKTTIAMPIKALRLLI